MEIINYNEEWERELIDIEKMGKGLIATKLAVFDSLGHIKFTVRRIASLKGKKEYRHSYFAESENGQWGLFKFNNSSVTWCGGTIKPTKEMILA